MAVVQGIVDYQGNVVRAQGNFKVRLRSGDVLRIEVTGQKTATAFVLATPWRTNTDMGAVGVTAAPAGEDEPDVMVFALPQYYGLSFRIEP